jgi:uncharacterized small protein (DUF1192 family)
LNPELVRGVEWWTHDLLSDPVTLEAAEMVAFDVLDPTLRSQGHHSAPAQTLYSMSEFKKNFRKVFSGAPTGTLTIETVAELSGRVGELETRIAKLEQDMKKK